MDYILEFVIEFFCEAILDVGIDGATDRLITTILKEKETSGFRMKKE